jgi:ribosomal RNA-processing protein 17
MGKYKSEIKFNPLARREFITGFKKRKDERRKIAQDKVKQEVKDKRKEIVQERKNHRNRIEEQYQQVTMLKKQEQPIQPEEEEEAPIPDNQ